MHKILGKKAAIAGAVAVIAIAVFAGAAFAAPVLQPGVTSAPGMSGTCTDCHTYAAPAAKPKAKPTVVSHPYISKAKLRARHTFKTWGYVAPKLPNTSEATLTISVQRLKGRSWVATSGLNATGTVSAKGKFKGKTNYTAKLKFGKAGRYRIRAKLVYLDAKGVEHTKWSKFQSVKIYK